MPRCAYTIMLMSRVFRYQDMHVPGCSFARVFLYHTVHAQGVHCQGVPVPYYSSLRCSCPRCALPECARRAQTQVLVPIFHLVSVVVFLSLYPLSFVYICVLCTSVQASLAAGGYSARGVLNRLLSR